MNHSPAASLPNLSANFGFPSISVEPAVFAPFSCVKGAFPQTRVSAYADGKNSQMARNKKFVKKEMIEAGRLQW